MDYNKPAWPDVLPLEATQQPGEPFPIEALGSTLCKAAMAIRKVIQAPDALCAQSVFAAAALACSGHYDVEIDGRRYPNTDFLFTVGVSGERKTATDNAALAAHYKYEKRLRVEAGTYLANADQKAGNSRVVPPILRVGDTTIEGLQFLFGEGISRLGIFTSEAGNILGGWSLKSEQRIRTAASLSSMWDGTADPRARGTSKLLVIAGRRLTAHFGCQPSIAAGFLGARDLNAQGILGRICIAWPDSTIGSRPYKSSNLSEEVDYQHYCERMTELLNKPLPVSGELTGELEPPTIPLDERAKSLWVKFHDAVEEQAGKGGRLYEIQPFACKVGEHVLRQSAILSEVAQEEVISVESIEKAILLANFYLGEWQRFFSELRVDPEVNLAASLLDWLRKTRRKIFTAADVYQRGPGSLRTSAKTAHEAIDSLCRHNFVRECFFEESGKSKRGFEVRPDA